MKKLSKKNSFLLFLNILQLLTILFSLFIYTSIYKFVPWYESCGIQFILIYFITVPILVLIEIILFIFKKYLCVSQQDINLPIISLLVFVLPILLDGGLDTMFLILGTLGGFIVLTLSIISTYKIINGK